MRWNLIPLVALAIAACGESSVEQRPARPLDAGGNGSVRISSFSAHHGRIRSADDTSEQTSVHASLQPDTGGSTVTFNGTPLQETIRDGRAHYAVYLLPNSTYYRWNGASNTFSISGAWHAGFSDSLPGPAAKTLITAPAIDDTVHRSQGFTVRWTPASADAAVGVTLADAGTGARSCGVKKFTADPGSATFSPSDLSCLTTGRMMITVARGTYAMDSLSPTQYIQLALASSDAIWVELAP